MELEYTDSEIALEVLKRVVITARDTRLVDRCNCNTGNIMISCPVHNNPNSVTCSVSIKDNMYHCFSCGSHGTLGQMYYELTGTSIRKELGLGHKAASLRPRRIEATPNYDTIPEVNIDAHIEYAPVKMIPAAYEYCKHRGFTDTVIDNLKMKYAQGGYTLNSKDPDAPEDERIIYYKDRLVIPIYEGGKLLCLEGRDVFGEDVWKRSHPDIKYMKCIYPRGGSTNTLFEWEKLDKKKTLYVTEGLMDVAFMRTSKTFQNSTALFGANISPRQFHLLRKFDDIVYIINNDLAGWRSLRQMKAELKKDFRVLLPPCGLDDVNEIFTKKGWTLDKAVDMKWLNYIRPVDEFDIDGNIKICEEKERR